MVQTKKSAKKAQQTLKNKLGPEGYLDFFRTIGAIGGRNGHTGGFASNHEFARKVGSTGGKVGKRGLKFIEKKGKKYIYINRQTGDEVILREGESWSAAKEKE